MEEKTKKDYFLPISIVLAALLIGGSLIFSAGKKTAPVSGDAPAAPDQAALADVIAKSDFQWLGDPKAPVTILEYADFQCPICGDFFSTVFPSLKKDFIDTGKVRLAHADFVFLGPESFAAAEAAYCAADQGKFWEFHNLLYQTEIKDGHENNGNLTNSLFADLAKQLNLDPAAFNSCVTNRKYQQKVLDETNQGKGIGVRATPTFFVGNVKIEGLDPADPYGKLKSVLEEALKNQ